MEARFLDMNTSVYAERKSNRESRVREKDKNCFFNLHYCRKNFPSFHAKGKLLYVVGGTCRVTTRMLGTVKTVHRLRNWN